MWRILLWVATVVWFGGAALGVEVSREEMRAVYEEVRTPFKYGVVVRPDAGKMVDCPGVFRFRDSWWMTYVEFDSVGYRTMLARSGDLLTWEKVGVILEGREGK